MLVILVLCCLQLGACSVGQEDTTFGEVTRIETLVETLQDPDFDARAESAGKEHGSINIEFWLPPAASVEAHMGQQQAHGGPSSQRELQQFRLQEEAVDTSLTIRHEPHHRSLEESARSRRISRTLLQDSFGEADALLQFKAEIENYTDNALDGWTTGNRSTYCSWTRVICDDELHVISLNFSRLKMNGTLGPSLGKLEYLEDLDLSHNFLLSELPVEWGRLQRLQTLNVNDNFLFGGVPAEYGNMSSLRVLYIGVQGWFFNGSIPEELGLLSELEVLALGTLFNFDAKQEYYPYRSNKMRGPIPKSIANCTKLCLADLKSILQINLSNNSLTGGIPPEFGGLENLQYLRLHVNKLTGEIPPELGRLQKMVYLILHSNNLTGTIPASLANCSSLKNTRLSNNELTGTQRKRKLGHTRGSVVRAFVLKPGNDQLCGPPLETTCVAQDSNASGSLATPGAPSSELLDGTFWRAFEIGAAIGVVILLGTLSIIPFTRHWLLHPQVFARPSKKLKFGVFREPT
ncbi:hypothetical protein AXG93_2752s1250 [Marchantia polymorpha subsp. ruderalis]|uniref:Leucine-rich repeat-containing N-terminal plant-type domain-containing protein n=1 Tax=Marchantia polymorpha subsp. ruderalis TaxID=1480154 RepID=A0A176VUR4_MARPO|nr:hypothetical protein AXG93_2752s1250 [Marchantia polymorpha subsp. ruderalis]